MDRNLCNRKVDLTSSTPNSMRYSVQTQLLQQVEDMDYGPYVRMILREDLVHRSLTAMTKVREAIFC
jgi:hypothetical protein